MRVLISGAGLAGPCLAHGLRRHGVDVLLLERDLAIDARAQGYRIHLNGNGHTALRTWLPAEDYEQAVATACIADGGVSFADPQLRGYTEIDLPPGVPGITVDRLTLRRIMLRGLADSTRFGAGFARYELLDNGGVRVLLTNGSTVDGDLLVAADGVNSGVRRQLLPDFPVSALDRRLIYGRTPLTARTRELTPAPALGGFLGVGGQDGRALALAAHRFRRDPAEFGLPSGEDYLMWGATLPADLCGPGFFDLGPEQLLELAVRALSDWHPSLTALLRLADLRYVVPASIQTSSRPAPWSPVPVTLVGDAAHPMPPAGISAGVAVHEAGLLATRLVSGAPLLDAVRAYEQEMLEHGFAAVATATRMNVRAS
ncbi:MULTISPECIES: NAD(P)/FAD-dependent oxidoreductase [unclassified Crossiella]|uniref:FAD-dependent oxidoreductase n=1 Tax=unclassified Crossiella TaxID=2620835 RepID=UPI001FFFF355|nr:MULTISPECIES: NAD(P)/FAD-dependent oxidoreductase [unclassified Crossiella]MCK2244800.1 FAD-dependent monooxygenase [Crossiella sp. S99.2]MCK2258442.1 FAD-dependent monooxygenase [Crossiella sp. S99.1]